MLFTRYALARELAGGRRVLELGCGAGVGLGLLKSVARSLVGADFSAPLLEQARRQYGPGVPLARLSAEELPFRDRSFDLVVFFEASYYVRRMDRAFGEVARVLAPNGSVLFANANPERPDFIRSPHSTHYHTADEFRAALEPLGFRVATLGGFPLVPADRTTAGRMVAAILVVARRVAEALHLVPTTLQGRARLKRLLYGRPRRAPAQLAEGFAAVRRPEPVPPGPVRHCKVIYVVGHKTPAG